MLTSVLLLLHSLQCQFVFVIAFVVLAFLVAAAAPDTVVAFLLPLCSAGLLLSVHLQNYGREEQLRKEAAYCRSVTTATASATALAYASAVPTGALRCQIDPCHIHNIVHASEENRRKVLAVPLMSLPGSTKSVSANPDTDRRLKIAFQYAYS